MKQTRPDRTRDIGVIIIGRNEGERLIACLQSALKSADHIVYVDSGSTDGSVAAATGLGADVVALDMSTPFTAARARNAGFQRLQQTHAPTFVQFVDGDCEIADGWLETAAAFLAEHPTTAMAAGDITEKFPERTIYNRLCDREWAGAPGETDSCGGNAMARAEAIKAVGGYDDRLIAGEEPEMCVRLRETGWTIFRLNTEMVRHDADIRSLGQWLKRARRTGHAFAEVSTLHRRSPSRIWARETGRALFWSGLGLSAVIGGTFLHPALWGALLVYPLQIARMALRETPTTAESWAHAALMIGQKPWEAAGVIQYWLGRLRKKPTAIIEHKAAP